MSNFDILESRTSTAQDIVYEPDSAAEHIANLISDTYDYYDQTGMLANKPYETLYKISRIARQTITGALGHLTIPTVMLATLEGNDQALPLKYAQEGQYAREQYDEGHPRMKFYTETGDVVDGTAIRSHFRTSTPSLQAAQEQATRAFCGASEAVLADGAYDAVWDVFSDTHQLFVDRWLAWKKYDETARGKTKYVQIPAEDSWLASQCSNIKITVGLVAAHKHMDERPIYEAPFVANAVNANERSGVTDLVLATAAQTYNGDETLCPADYQQLKTLLLRNSRGSGLCCGRLKLKPHPEAIAVAKEFAAYTKYPLSLDKGFSYSDTIFAYVAKKLSDAVDS